MLPLSLLRAAQGSPMLVELKNGETYNGTLEACDGWMNLMLSQVICTSRDGTRFWSLPEVYVRGNNLKYLRIPDEILAKARDEAQDAQGGGAGGRRDTKVISARGRGRGGGRGGYQQQGQPQQQQQQQHGDGAGRGGGQYGRGGGGDRGGGRGGRGGDRGGRGGGGDRGGGRGGGGRGQQQYVARGGGRGGQSGRGRGGDSSSSGGAAGS